MGGLRPPIDPEMSGSQVVLRPPGFAPDSTERFSRSQTGRPGFCLPLPLMAKPFRGLSSPTVAALQLFKTASQSLKQTTNDPRQEGNSHSASWKRRKVQL